MMSKKSIALLLLATLLMAYATEAMAQRKKGKGKGKGKKGGKKGKKGKKDKGETRDCKGPEAVTRECKAYASLSITATDGRCRGKAGANCKVWTQSENVYQEAISEWLAKPGEDLCDGASVNATASAVATAIAAVWANSFVKLRCTGGYACGWTLANAKGLAASVAESLALAVSDASAAGPSAEVAESFCYADVRAVGASLAEAWADAQAETCAENGDSDVLQASYAFSAQTTVAKALAVASAKICSVRTGKTADLQAESLCEGDASVVRTDQEDAYGDACASAVKVNLCKGPGAEICCATDAKSRICRFTSAQKKACGKDCSKPWVIIKNVEGSIIYETAQKDQCLCDTQ